MSNPDHLFSGLSSLVTNKPEAVFSEVKVLVNASHVLFSTYTHEQYLTLLSIKPDLRFTDVEFHEYCATILRSRVNYVTGLGPVVVKPTDNICVPAYLSLLLAQIGKVFETKLGMELIPVYDGSDGLMPFEQVVSIARELFSLKNYGLEYSVGYIRDKKGSFDFMSMQLVANAVMNEVDSIHPVYALLASTVNIRHASTAFFPRFNYGSVDQLRHYLVQVSLLKEG